MTKRAYALLGPLAAVALAGACATRQPTISYCRAATALPAPAPECASAPEVRRVKSELEAIAVPAVHFNGVRVGFDAEGRVGSLCVERAPYTDGWAARSKLAAREAELRAVAAGPACLAGTSLELNRFGARRAEIDAVVDECRREATSERTYRSCIEREQIQRGEIWMLEIGQVYVRAAGASERRAALVGCTQDATPIGIPTDTDSDSVHRPDPAEVTPCLRSHGWEALD